MRLHVAAACVIAWAQWTAIIAFTWLFLLTWFGAQWVSWTPVLIVLISAGVFSAGLVVYFTSGRRIPA
jgi:hypothetical protein